jgi:hypothetical protein
MFETNSLANFETIKPNRTLDTTVMFSIFLLSILCSERIKLESADVSSEEEITVFELSKNKWGLTISRHAIDLNRYFRMYGGGLKLTPQSIPGHLVWGVKQTIGAVQPPTPRQFKHRKYLI